MEILDDDGDGKYEFMARGVYRLDQLVSECNDNAHRKKRSAGKVPEGWN